MWQKLKQPHHLAIAFESKKEGQQPFLPFHTLTCTLNKAETLWIKTLKKVCSIIYKQTGTCFVISPSEAFPAGFQPEHSERFVPTQAVLPQIKQESCAKHLESMLCAETLFAFLPHVIQWACLCSTSVF